MSIVPVVLKTILIIPLSIFCLFQRVELLSAQSSDSQETPLFLTPLLEENKTFEAQILSRVKPDIVNTSCFTGYFTVDRDCESNLFFWFCQAQKNWERSPVILWLQGGPGGSSLYGLFKEIGPFSFENGTAMERKYSWNANSNLLFIDQPVGTGFSFTGKNCYAKNKNDVAKDLYSAITQFYHLFPSLNANGFYIAGESYAGHYIPYIAQYIHNNNSTKKDMINLRGMMIGNGWMDSYYQYDFGNFLYNIGLIDEKQNKTLYEYLLKLRTCLEVKDWKNASFWSGELSEKISISLRMIDRNNYLKNKKNNTPPDGPVDFSLLRKSIHVGSQKFAGRINEFVFYSLAHDNVYDYIQSTKDEIEELLEHYPIIFYFGQLDTLCPYSLGVSFLRELQWSGTKDYPQALRRPWCVKSQLAGFYKSSHNLHEVLVRNAGHSVPVDQPLWAFLLADSLTSSPPDDPLQKLTACESQDQLP